MTLVVSLRVPDGVIIAVDSLTTIRGTIEIEVDIEATCNKCGEKITIPNFKPPPVQFPSSISMFAQKLFPLKKLFGVGSFGGTAVNGRSIYSQIKRLERQLPDIASVDEVAKHVEEYFIAELEAEVGDVSQLPDKYTRCGFHIVGYSSPDATIGKTCTVRIGKEPKRESYDTFGCTISGDQGVVMKLWRKDKDLPVPTPIYKHFSLQDAIDYAEFLIRTTADYQRFANMIPTVGGEADIALVTHYSGFTWIKSKQLIRVLEAQQY